MQDHRRRARSAGRITAANHEPVGVANQLRSLRLEHIRPEDWVVIAVAAGLVFDLLILPWFSFGATINVGSTTISIGGSLTGADAPDAWLGVLAVLSCAFLITDLGFERLSPETKLPTLATDRLTTRFVLATIAAGLIALKFLFHIGRFGELALGFWLAVLLVAALVALTRRARLSETVGATSAAAPASAPAADTAPETNW
jgi:hypothetical protein